MRPSAFDDDRNELGADFVVFGKDNTVLVLEAATAIEIRSPEDVDSGAGVTSRGEDRPTPQIRPRRLG
jgi:hypothetical protein